MAPFVVVDGHRDGVRGDYLDIAPQLEHVFEGKQARTPERRPVERVGVIEWEYREYPIRITRQQPVLLTSVVRDDVISTHGLIRATPAGRSLALWTERLT